MNNYEFISSLGTGGFGTVTKQRDKMTGEIVAIKMLKERCVSFSDSLELKEIKSLRRIKSDNVIKLLRIFKDNSKLYMVFELLDHSLLTSISERKQPFSDGEVRYIIQQVLLGLDATHKQGFFHRDIKPDNLIWSFQNQLKICDYGLAKEIRSRPPYTDYLGTRWYRAPEMLLQSEMYSSPVDIWALGAIMAELYLLKPFFPGGRGIDQLIKIFSILGTPFDWPEFARLSAKQNLKIPFYQGVNLSTLMPNACPAAIDLMSLMLTFNPLRRPSAETLLKHPFFDGSFVPYSRASSGRSQLQAAVPEVPTLPKINNLFPKSFTFLAQTGTETNKLPSLGKKDFTLNQQESQRPDKFFDMVEPRKNMPLSKAGRWNQNSIGKIAPVVQTPVVHPPAPYAPVLQQRPVALPQKYLFALPGMKKKF